MGRRERQVRLRSGQVVTVVEARRFLVETCVKCGEKTVRGEVVLSCPELGVVSHVKCAEPKEVVCDWSEEDPVYGQPLSPM